MAKRSDSGTGKSRPAPPAAGPPALKITTHRALVGERTAIIAALAADPRSSRMLAANPALALRAVGVQLSPAIADHILHAVQQPAEVRSRRAELITALTKDLGTAPHPSDPARLAEILFGALHLHPLATAGRQPTYLPAIPAASQDRLRALLPTPDHRLPARSVPTPPTEPTAPPAPPTRPPPVWRLDLDAPVPPLPRARSRPKQVTLPELWFYLPSHELVRPLLELGILEVSVMPVLPPGAFAKVRDGGQTGGLTDWIESVTFPRGSRKAAPP